MESKKIYTKPELKTRTIELGVFGEYGGGVTPGGGGNGPHPSKITNPYDFMIE